jgi:hypothetical protein
VIRLSTSPEAGMHDRLIISDRLIYPMLAGISALPRACE